MYCEKGGETYAIVICAPSSSISLRVVCCRGSRRRYGRSASSPSSSGFVRLRLRVLTHIGFIMRKGGISMYGLGMLIGAGIVFYRVLRD